jgi:hypothetical protein
LIDDFRAQGPAEQLFGLAKAIGAGRVEQVDTEMERCASRRDGRAPIHDAVVAAGGPVAQGESGDSWAAFAELNP